MTLPYRQERLLRQADRALAESDPDLASMMAIFALITAADRMPAWEQLRPRLAWVWSAVLWPAAGFVFLIVVMAGGGSRAAIACSTAVRDSRPRLFSITSRRRSLIRTLSKG
jgi:Protein of unknown function (DUF3040)